jgi:formylglycine-generating enzyme required for sulfatase activity/cephalosporin-C deacetylase-like acetyl esterase/predicted Ser/Thr protein kinase
MRLLHYEVLEKLGEGGMGIVYKARDTHLDRFVALKILPPEKIADSDRKLRFVKEAKAASALNHPNIITIHDIAQDGGADFIVMEYVDGKTLDQVIPTGGMPPPEGLSYAIQITSALARAHQAGIIHRDVKPSNIMVDGHGHAKVLDFGLAKLTEAAIDSDAAATRTIQAPMTVEGTVVGTFAYMSPEQAEGNRLDPRSDVFSFGTVFYEMVTGRRAFPGPSTASILAALLLEDPKPVRELARDAPPEFEHIIVRCMRKDREARYPSMAAVNADLENCRSALGPAAAGAGSLKLIARQVKRARVAIPALLILLLLVSGVAWLLQRSARTRWATMQALPEITHLIEQEKFADAFSLAGKANQYIPDDPTLAGLWPIISRPLTLQTTPPGAEVFRKSYQNPAEPWQSVGRTPLEKVRVPRGMFRWKIEKPGFRTVEGSRFTNPFGPSTVSLSLDEESKAPAEMVRVSLGSRPVTIDIPGFEDLPPVTLPDYWIDRYEVTNAEFKRFVDQGGYSKPEYWKHEFRKDGRTLSWADAMPLFRDATARPGPAGWVQGEYPAGQGDYPVGGVSWFEAAAYAEFAGKSLPTIWHWNKAAGSRTSSSVVPASNFGGQGIARVGSFRGLGPWGTYDMAGNVKEWCWNESDIHHRYVLGGAWDEPSYLFTDADARSPFVRLANIGFRCVRYVSGPGDQASAPVASVARDYNREKPISDELFRAYRGLYSYDKTPLNAVVEATDRSNDSWKREKISFQAAYGNERVIAYLYLPKNTKPPLQTVVFFHGSNAILARSIASANTAAIDFVIKSGRAVLLPVYKGTFERGDELASDYPNTTSFYRDHVIAWSKDLGRSIDYLETRPDIDRNRLAFYGLSWGGAMGAIMLPIETRFQAAVLYVGGFYLQKALPEVDQINFLPRVKIPVLMLNGRYDFFLPVGTAQLPFYRLLGTPKEHKRYMVYDTGHNIPRTELIKETLDWLDRYLGPVK